MTASSRASASTSTACSSPGPPRRRSTSSTSSASRSCAARRARSSARTRPRARSTSPRASPRSRPRPTSNSTTATSDSCRRRRRFPGRCCQKVAGRAVVLGHAARRHASTTRRPSDDVNDLNNLGLRGQLLYRAVGRARDHLAADYTRQRPEGYTQVVAGVAPTLRNGEPPVSADRRRPGLYAAELQRLRSA